MSTTKISDFALQFSLRNHINKRWSYSGIDSYEMCISKKRFESYPYEITYKYNSLGFRDDEWPSDTDELKNAIWCIGDSFTTGLGSPIEHTWFRVLQKKTNIRCINISMDGASNEWISMLANYISENFKPKNIVCCWSYPERRINKNIEILKNDLLIQSYNDMKDYSWPKIKNINDFNELPFDARYEYLKYDHQLSIELSNDFKINEIHISQDELKLQSSRESADQDLENMVECITSLNAIKNTVIHSFIPNFCNPAKFKEYKEKLSEIVVNPIYIDRIDIARDGHHFDILTSTELVKNIIKQLNLDKQ